MIEDAVEDLIGLALQSLNMTEVAQGTVQMLRTRTLLVATMACIHGVLYEYDNVINILI